MQKFWDESTHRNIVIMVERMKLKAEIQGPQGSSVTVYPGEYICRDLHGFAWREQVLLEPIYPSLSQCSSNIFIASTSLRMFIAKKSFLVKKYNIPIFRGDRGDAVMMFSAGTFVVIRRGLNQKDIFSAGPAFFPLHVDATEKHEISFSF